jgi:hypothetical protein
MKAIVLALAALVATATAGGAQLHGRIAIFSDAALTDSTVVDAGSQVIDVYIAHVDHPGVVGSQFRTVADPGFTGVWLSETSPWFVIGTSPTGVSIWYAYNAGCVTTDIVLIKATYWLTGTSVPCSRLRVVGHPEPDYIICTGCNMWEAPCSGGSLRVACPVSTKESTWGRVKALYR